jgi:hypothetical protein
VARWSGRAATNTSSGSSWPRPNGISLPSSLGRRLEWLERFYVEDLEDLRLTRGLNSCRCQLRLQLLAERLKLLLRPRHVRRDAAVADSRGGRERRRVRESFPRTILAEGDLAENDHLAIELVDPADTPQQVVVHWPTKATAVRPAAYGEAAAKAMRLLANADMELARLRARGRQPKVER